VWVDVTINSKQPYLISAKIASLLLSVTATLSPVPELLAPVGDFDAALTTSFDTVARM